MRAPRQPAYTPLATRLTGVLTGVALVATAACSSEPVPTTKKEVGLTLSGEFEAKISGKTVTLDYTDGKADINLVHRLSTKGKSCVTSVHMQITKADESCLLDLTFRPGAGNALTLMEGQFHAINKNTFVECEDWPGLKPGKSQVYTLKSGKDTFALTKPVDQPYAGQKDAAVQDKSVLVTGTASFKLGGKSFSATFTKLKVEGTIKSTGNANASCGALTGAAQCPATDEVTLGNAVGNHLKRPGYVYDCATGEQYSFDEHCGSDAIWLTMYRRWTEVACGGCAADETCVKKFTDEKTYQARCYKKSDKCGACSDAKKTACAQDKEGKDACVEPVVDGEDMTIKAVLDEYNAIHENFATNNVAAIFVVAEGTERARGKCTEKDGSTTCDGSGPAATQKDCEAVKAKFKLADDVVLLFDKNKKYWVSDDWLGPEHYSNGMMVMSSSTEITDLFPLPGSSSQAGAESVKAAIQKAIDDF
jgi:hypothetical protein